MRSTTTTSLFRALALVACATTPSLALAQNPPAGDPGGDPGAAPQGPPVTVVQVPAAQPAQPSYPGYLPPPGYDPNGHLPSSSRASTDVSKSTDGFDLNKGTNGPVSVRGSANGSFVTEGAFVPNGHTVRRGDTLWEISQRYYNNPYHWPRLWSYNPQVQNPHWIYPGDRIRLRDPNVAASANRLGLDGRRGVPPGTVFLRDYGWVDDKTEDTWGEIVGSPSDRMMLSHNDDVYIQLDDKHEVAVGDQLTIFRPIRTVESENAKGELVSIRGTAKIERYNPKTHMCRAKIIESIDVIERGVKVGPVGRKFDVVPPIKSDRDLEASILASLYPNHFYGQNQVVFIDRGEKDGVRPGMRFFAVMRGDRWQQNIKSAGSMARLRPRVEDDRPARVDDMAIDTVDEDKLPDETFAELRVLRVREHTATALVVQSKHEVERNSRLIARKGF
jgi:LysM repeat protein